MHCSTKIINIRFPDRRNWWLLFGSPSKVRKPTPGKSAASAELLFFEPESVFGLSRQTLNDYGVTDWEVWFLRAVRPGESAHVIPGVKPGAEILLYAHGKANATCVQRYVDLLEELGADPTDHASLHRKAAPYLQQGVLPERLVRAHLDDGRAG